MNRTRQFAAALIDGPIRALSGGRAAPNAWVGRAMMLLTSIAMVLWSAVATAQADGGPGSSMAPAAGAASAQASIPASRAARNIAIVTIKGPIDDTTFKSVQRRLKLAERAGADAIVIELDTPGGEIGAVLKICTAIKSSPIKNTVAWVNRDAFSGGAIIALACREVVTNDPAKLGDALPVIGAPGLGILTTINKLPENERQKLLSPLMAELVESARMFGRDELLVQGIVSRGVELWLVENPQTGQRFAINEAEYRTLFGEEPVRGVPVLSSAPGDRASSGTPDAGAPAGTDPAAPQPGPRGRRGAGTAPSGVLDDPHPFIPATPELAGLKGDMRQRPVAVASPRPTFSAADRGQWRLVEYISSGEGPFVFSAPQLLRYELATQVVRDDTELMAFFGAKHALRMDATWSEGLVAFLTLLPVRGVLLVLFLLGLFIEMTHPGTVAPGLIAMVALLGLLAPPLLINLANWWEIAAILVGIALIVLEIFVIPGLGLPGILGLLLVMGGLIGTFIPAGNVFPDTPAQERGLTYGAVTLLLSFTTAGVLMYLVARNFGSLPVFNRLVLKDAPPPDEQPGDELLRAMAESVGPVKVGMAGRALTTLRPAGRAEIDGRVVDVVAEIGFVPAGAPLRVVSVSDFRIAVEQADA